MRNTVRYIDRKNEENMVDVPRLREEMRRALHTLVGKSGATNRQRLVMGSFEAQRLRVRDAMESELRRRQSDHGTGEVMKAEVGDKAGGWIVDRLKKRKGRGTALLDEARKTKMAARLKRLREIGQALAEATEGQQDRGKP